VPGRRRNAGRGVWGFKEIVDGVWALEALANCFDCWVVHEILAKMHDEGPVVGVEIKGSVGLVDIFFGGRANWGLWQCPAGRRRERRQCRLRERRCVVAAAVLLGQAVEAAVRVWWFTGGVL
jgi:hypothetical protein